VSVDEESALGANGGNSRRRAGKQVRTRIRSEIWASTRKNWRVLATVFAVWLLATISGGAAAIATGRTHFAAFFGGLMLGALGLLWQGFLAGQGFTHRQLGGEAERWTADELAKLDKRWLVYHDVPLPRANVDHVVLGPGRIFAVETKWTSSRGVEGFLRRAAGVSRHRAQELERRLADQGCPRRVVPILVVWGAGVAPQLGEKPRLVSGTRVVAGNHSKVWLERIAGAADRLEFDLLARQAVERIIAEGDASQSANMTMPVSQSRG
jgi:hypothetical protein